MSILRRRPFFLAGFILLLVLGLRPAAAVELPTDFVDELVGAGIIQPVNFEFLPDGRVLLVERTTANIRLVVPGTGSLPEPVGTVPDVGVANGEQGLLGIAVDPRWPAAPYLYVHHTSASTQNIKVVRFEVTGDLDFTGDGVLNLDLGSRREVLADLPNDALAHNGGTLVFGPDGYLYVALGDDGVACAAQDIHQLRGKILRLDVSGIPAGPGPVWPYASLSPPGNPFRSDPDPRARLVWHLGLRNPWSFDFDPYTGHMAIADVGENRWEEVDVASTGGRNFGWPLLEGAEPREGTDCGPVDLSGLTLPVYDYPHDPLQPGATVILGGICHRSTDVVGSFPTDYWGDVFFLDMSDGLLRRLKETDGAWAIADSVPGQPTPGAWGRGFEYAPRMRFGPDGSLWYVRFTELRRISYQGVPVGVAEPVAASPLRLQAFPSPARASVTLDFTVRDAGPFRLAVFDAQGRRVRSMAEEVAAAPGPARRTWDGRSDAGTRVPAGLYFVRLESGTERAGRRVVLLGER